MSGTGLIDDLAVHATGVAIGSRALLIFGRSRTGKSRMACALIGLSRRNRPIRLIGDDRILLRATDRGVVARPHPRIAGFIERRGLGIVAADYAEHALVAGLLMLQDLSGRTAPVPSVLRRFPCRTDLYRDDAAPIVLGWWRGACTTQAAKSFPPIGQGAKD